MKKSVLILTGLLVSGGMAFAAWPDGPRGPQRARRGQGPNLGVLKQELGLSDAQVSQIERLRADQHKAAIRRRADLQIAHVDLKELMAANTVDERAVAAKVKEITDLQAANTKARVDSQLAFRKVLTAEQAQKLKELRAKPRPQRAMRPRGRFAPGQQRPQAAPPAPGAVSDLGDPDDLGDDIEEMEPLEGPEQS